MKLSKRLKTICDFVCENSKVIDVGCDHGLTSIYLNKYKNCIVLATDVSKDCIIKAKNNIVKYEATVDTMVTDGLDGIDLSDEVIILSGMGTHTILKILDRNITNDLVISTHNDFPLLRRSLYEKGYYLDKETVIYDKRYYVIGYYKYGKGKKIDYVLSPFLMKDKSYLNYLYEKYKVKAKYEKKLLKKMKYKHLMYKIRKTL